MPMSTPKNESTLLGQTIAKIAASKFGIKFCNSLQEYRLSQVAQLRKVGIVLERSVESLESYRYCLDCWY